MATEFQLLEINLISAQSLKKKKPTTPANMRQMQTYAVAWVDPTAKLRTRVDRIGIENPTWNDKFIFRVPSSFLHPSSASSSAVCFEIYAVGLFHDTLIGTVRFLIGNLKLSPSVAVPSFAALQVRRPSGRFHGVLNVGATLLPDSLHVTMSGKNAAAIGYRDLMGENRRSGGKMTGKSGKSSSTEHSLESPDSKENRALRDLNEGRERSDGGGKRGLLSRLGFQRKIHLSPSDQDLQKSCTSDEKRG